MGFFDFLRRSGKQVELKQETLKAEISQIGFNANAYEVLVDEGTVTIRGLLGLLVFLIFLALPREIALLRAR